MEYVASAVTEEHHTKTISCGSQVDCFNLVINS